MANRSPHQLYVGLLMQRVLNDNHPSSSDLDRIERSMTTPDEVATYLQYLLEKVAGSNNPSSQMMDRVERLLAQIPVRS
jgi:hypothetical protein